MRVLDTELRSSDQGMLSMRICFLAILFVLVSSWSYGETPSPGVSTNKPNNKNTNPQKNPEPDQRGTDQAPFVVKVHPAPPSEPPPAPDANKEKYKSPEWDWWWDKSPEILIALFTLCLWLATRKLVKDADETAKKELRAYVGIERVRIIDFDDNFPHRGQFIIQNFGKTMAMNTNIWINGVMTDKDIFHFPLEDKDIKSTTVVMPNESIGGIEQNLPRHPRNIANTADITKSFYLWGRIEYKDVFGKPHWTIFRFRSYRRAHYPDEGGGSITYGHAVKATGKDSNNAT